MKAGRSLYTKCSNHTQFLRVAVVLAVHKDIEDKRCYFGCHQHVEQKGVPVCPLCKQPISSHLSAVRLTDRHRSSP